MTFSIENLPEFIRQLPEVTQVPRSPLSPAQIEDLYADAYQAYQKKSYSESLYKFLILFLFNKTESRFIKGMAASLQRQEKYKEAAQVYEMLFEQAPDDIDGGLQGVLCWFLAKEKIKGVEMLEMISEHKENQSRLHSFESKISWLIQEYVS